MSVKVSGFKEISTRFQEKRRGQRMNSRVQVRLDWSDADGKRVQVEGHTRIVNPYGCMIVLKEPLELEHRLALTNVAMNCSNAAVVVWKGGSRPDGWEYGIELVAPEMDFWGLELFAPRLRLRQSPTTIKIIRRRQRCRWADNTRDQPQRVQRWREFRRRKKDGAHNECCYACRCYCILQAAQLL